MAMQIKLTKGRFATVDEEDFVQLSKVKWSFDGRYAVRWTGTANKRKCIMMHRVINNTPEGFLTDHIDGNGLNNQKSNLRTATIFQNQYNSKTPITNKSGHKGIVWHKRDRLWQTTIRHDGIREYLGCSKNIEDAIKLYKKAALEFHQEFARV